MTTTTALREPSTHPRRRPATLGDVVTALLVAGACSLVAFVVAQLGLNGMVAAAGAIATIVALIVVRDRMLVGLALVPLSLVVLLHKSFGPLADNVHSGALGLHVSTLNAATLLLYLVWAREGTMRRDISAVFRVPAVWAPLAAAALMVPSIVGAADVHLAVSELARLLGIYALFLLLAARVRRPREFGVVLGAFLVNAFIQLGVTTLQWRTGGVLGLDFLGVPTELGERMVDAGVIGRPFGTIVHPVFLGAFMASLALMALALAIRLERRWQRVTATVAVLVSVAPVAIAQARAAALALALVAVALIGWGARRRLVPRRLLAGGLLAMVAVGVVTAPSWWSMLEANLLEEQVGLEWESRQELNDAAIDMIADAPLVGHGLNNFEQVLPGYDRFGFIFAGNPVHNLALLQASETGLLGLIGLLLVAVTLTAAGIRAARSPVALHSALGAGFVAVLGFYALEEMFQFSLRQSVPLATFWVFAGLAVAAAHLSGRPLPLPPVQPLPRGVGKRAWRTPTATSLLSVALIAPLVLQSATATTGPSAADDAVIDEPEGSPDHLDPEGSPDHLDELADEDTGAPVDGSEPMADGDEPVAGEGPADPDEIAPVARTQVDGTRLVFSAYDRDTGTWGIYTADERGEGVTRLTPPDGRRYNWPSWAFNGQRIVFTASEPGERGVEHIYLMKPDGTGLQRLTDQPWRFAQPDISPDGTTMAFTAVRDGYGPSGIYTMDLATGHVTNLSAVGAPFGALDTDPRWTTDDRIVFARSVDDAYESVPTQVWIMGADGRTARRPIVASSRPAVDPVVSTNGRLAYGTYQRDGSPARDATTAELIDAWVHGTEATAVVEMGGWRLATSDLDGSGRRFLTAGDDCHERDVLDPCDPADGSAFVPRWTPDDRRIGYVSALTQARTCICVIDPATGEAAALLDRYDLAVDWFDWVVPSGPPSGAVLQPFGAVDDSEILLVSSDTDGPRRLERAGPDLFGRVRIDLPSHLEPEQARWSPDRRFVVFTAEIDEPDIDDEPPAPPRGETRREHFTLDMLDAVFSPPLTHRPGAARAQVFVLDLDSGRVRQLTTATTEDHRSGIRLGELRGNRDPSVSPDGRHVVVTNVSSLTDESFILRIDVASGEVLNLTNATSGAVPVADSAPAYSPDGDRIAFVQAVDDTTDLYLMDPEGYDVRRLTDQRAFALAPAWSPNGDSIAFLSFDGRTLTADTDRHALPADGWSLRVVEVATGRVRTVLDDTGPLSAPAWSPNGDALLLVGAGPTGTGQVLNVSVADGTARVVQLSPTTQEHFVDWR